MYTYRLTAVLLMFTLFVANATAAALYRYKDDNGRTVMSASVPPEIVPKGYEILNAQGRVIERVAPALTEEEKRIRDEAIAAEEKRQQMLKERREEDARLLQQYGDSSTVKLILERRLSEIDAVIESRQATIAAAKRAIAAAEEQAADYQRQGKQIPQRVSSEIDRSKSSIVESEQVIEERTQFRAEVNAEFTDIIERLDLLNNNGA